MKKSIRKYLMAVCIGLAVWRTSDSCLVRATREYDRTRLEWMEHRNLFLQGGLFQLIQLKKVITEMCDRQRQLEQLKTNRSARF